MAFKQLGDAGDGVAVVLAFGAFAKWLPPLAALAALIWTSIRIYEWARVVLLGKPPRQGFD